jgi:Skp family chaperone for outer membrane proteins
MPRGASLAARGLTALALLALPAMPAPAQERAPDGARPPASPILVLDQDRMLTDTAVADRIAAEVDRRASELAAENRAIEAELSAEELALTERRKTLPVDEFRALADAFDAKVQRIRAEQDAKERALQQMREQERQGFLRRVTPILAEIVRERGALLMLDRRTVLLSADAIDITDEAIARIDAALAAAPAGDGILAPVLPETRPDAAPDPVPAPEVAPDPGLPPAPQ